MLTQGAVRFVPELAGKRQFEHVLPFVTKTYTTVKTELAFHWQID